MSSCPSEILETAERLFAIEPQTEAQHRAVVSRSYYSAYHHCSEFHNGLNSPGMEPQRDAGGIHERLIHRLIAPTCSEANKMRSKALGYQLRTLKIARVTADYQLSSHVAQLDAEGAIENARVILEH